MSKYPQVNAQLLFGGKTYGNPKINNMSKGYKVSQYDLLFVSDSDNRIEKDVLLQMVLALDEDVGIVYQMPFICHTTDFTCSVEKQIVALITRLLLVSHLIGLNVVLGKSNLIRKGPIEKAGGLQTFDKFISEDCAIGKYFRKNGWRIEMVSIPTMLKHKTSFRTVIKRYIRWHQLGMIVSPWSYLFTPLWTCFLLGFLASYAFNVLFAIHFHKFFVMHVTCWFLLEIAQMKAVENSPIDTPMITLILSWIVREFLGFFVILIAFCKRKIRWGKQIYKMNCFRNNEWQTQNLETV